MQIADVTCTVWRKGPEVDRVSTWTRTYVRCHWEPTAGSTRNPDGDDSTDSLKCIVWNDGAILDGDRLSYGIVESDTPTDDAYTATSIKRYTFNGNYHHTEVDAR